MIDSRPLALCLTLLIHHVSYTAPSALADTAFYTNPSWNGFTSPLFDPCVAGPLPERNPLTMRLYGARAYQGSNWTKLYIRSHIVQPGMADTFDLYDDVAWTYWLTAGNAAGQSCDAGITVGVPLVGVGLDAMQERSRTVYDIAGRKLLAIDAPPGVYFELIPGQRAKRVVRLR